MSASCACGDTWWPCRKQPARRSRCFRRASGRAGPRPAGGPPPLLCFEIAGVGFAVGEAILFAQRVVAGPRLVAGRIAADSRSRGRCRCGEEDLGSGRRSGRRAGGGTAGNRRGYGGRCGPAGRRLGSPWGSKSPSAPEMPRPAAGREHHAGNGSHASLRRPLWRRGDTPSLAPTGPRQRPEVTEPGRVSGAAPNGASPWNQHPTKVVGCRPCRGTGGTCCARPYPRRPAR